MRKDYFAINLIDKAININIKSIYKTVFSGDEVYNFNVMDDIYYSYVLVQKGTLSIKYKKNIIIELNEGNAVFLWIKDTESIEIIGTECIYYWIFFTVLDYTIPIIKPFALKNVEKASKSFDTIIDYINSQNILSISKANMVFMDYVLSGIKTLDDKLEYFNSTYSLEIINSINYIKSNISKNLLVEDLANQQNMNIAQYRKHFKKIIGEYPAKYIYEQRLLIAKDYLLNTNYTLNQIADFVGFENSYYLSNCFKRKYGLSPKNYLKKYKNIYRKFEY